MVKNAFNLRNLLLLGFTVLMGAIYIYGIVNIPIWIDEAFTMQQARLSILTISKQAIFNFDVVHLAYYLVSNIILNIFSDSLVTLRLFSFTLTLLTCLNIFKIGKSLVNKKVGTLSACAYPTIPSTFDFATQARSSSLVTYLVTLVLISLIREDSTHSSKSIVKINLLFGFHVIVNITTVVAVPVYLLLIRILRPSADVKHEFRSRFLVPLIAVIPLAVIAKSQDEQISWIDSSFSPLRESVTVFLWPFIESENRFIDSFWIYPVGLTIALLFSFTLKRARHIGHINVYHWLLIFYFLPSVALWIFSLVYPILLTRHIAYSGIAFALLLGLSLSFISSNSFKAGISIGLIMFSISNGLNIFENRDSQFDWKSKNGIIEKITNTPVLVASPGWYTPMLKYYSPIGYEVKSIDQLAWMSKIVNGDRCKVLPSSVFLVGISDTIERVDSEQLEKLDYEASRLESNTTAGIEYFKLKGC